jgi:hypothetical protein
MGRVNVPMGDAMEDKEKLIAFVYANGQFVGLAEVSLKLITRVYASFSELREAALALEEGTRTIDVHLRLTVPVSTEYFEKLFTADEKKPA